MTPIALINFEEFTLHEVCSFVVNRIYPAIKHKINIINEYLYDSLIEGLQINNDFGIHFSRLSDEIFQLMRLEEKVLFEFVKSKQLESNSFAVSENSKARMQQHHALIQKSLLELRLTFSHISTALHYKNASLILLDTDLFELESLVKNWVAVVNQRILILNCSERN